MGTHADTGVLEQSLNLIGQQGYVGDSNLYSEQWPCYIPAASESYDMTGLKL